ncbi:NADP-dependent oxidoreductase domain-containing protein [Xylogone sp. PMI_703]|nr:NADP-dependent oxidoreductase domain-containing protein [Xylogone sp. PMI_703]
MPHPIPKIILGTAGIALLTPEEQKQFLSVLDKYNVKDLDTARLYQDSEKTLKALDAPSKYSIHTKAMGFYRGSMQKQKVLDSMQQTLEDLGVNSVDIYYLHSPDPDTPIEDTLSAIQELYAAGKFKQFGLSNFPPSDVQKIYDIQKAANSVLPTIFQGNYNAVSRHIESDLFPVLRKLNIAFYAYSPIAGGFLVKDPAAIRAGQADGRFNKESQIGAMYNNLYAKESLLTALEEYTKIAADAGISKAALAYRWLTFHSNIKAESDGVIVGASKSSQLEETLKAINDGPLDAGIAQRVDAIWASVKHEAPRDNWASAGW